MHRIAFVCLLRLVGQAYAEDKLSDKTIIDRASGTPPLQNGDLDSTLLGKPGNIAVPVQANLPLVTSPLAHTAPPRGPTHVARAATLDLSRAKGPDLWNKNYHPKGIDSSHKYKNWFVIDAENLIVGKLATEIANVARGKHKPTYTPSMNMGDRVIVINADKVQLPGNQMDRNKGKKYFSHAQNKRSGAGIVGSGKFTSAYDILHGPFPERVLRKAVNGMLPKNNLNREEIRENIKIYAGSEHPHRNIPAGTFPSAVKHIDGSWVRFAPDGKQIKLEGGWKSKPAK